MKKLLKIASMCSALFFLLTGCNRNDLLRPAGVAPGPIITLSYQTTTVCSGWGTGTTYPVVYSDHQPSKKDMKGNKIVTFNEVAYVPEGGDIVRAIEPTLIFDTPCTVTTEPGKWSFELASWLQQ